MRRLSLAFIAAVSTIALSQIASAADLPRKAPAYTPPPPPAVYNWTGWYIGGNVGYGWGRDTGSLWDSFTDPPGGSTIPFGTAEYFALGGNVLPGVKPKGIIGGGQIGYNWQVAPNWVLGAVADIQASDMHDSASASVAPPNFASTIQSNSSKIEWFGTVRGRVGYAANNWLFYGTGGLAYGRVKTDLTFNCACGPPSNIIYAGSNSTTNVGWAAGAGVEVGLTPNWTIGVEYLHIDLGDLSTTATFVSGFGSFLATFTANSTFAADIVRGTINYKF